MPSKKLIAVVLVAVLAVAMGFVVTWGYVHKDADGFYDYDISYSKSFEDADGNTVLSSPGKTFAIADVVVKNDSYAPGISTSVSIMVWELTLDRMKHEPNPAYTILHPGYSDGITINEGRTWGYTVVFEVSDESVGKRDAGLTYRYVSLTDKLDLRYDPDLRLGIYRHETIGLPADGERISATPDSA